MRNGICWPLTTNILRVCPIDRLLDLKTSGVSRNSAIYRVQPGAACGNLRESKYLRTIVRHRPCRQRTRGNTAGNVPVQACGVAAAAGSRRCVLTYARPRRGEASKTGALGNRPPCPSPHPPCLMFSPVASADKNRFKRHKNRFENAAAAVLQQTHASATADTHHIQNTCTYERQHNGHPPINISSSFFDARLSHPSLLVAPGALHLSRTAPTPPLRRRRTPPRKTGATTPPPHRHLPLLLLPSPPADPAPRVVVPPTPPAPATLSNACRCSPPRPGRPRTCPSLSKRGTFSARSRRRRRRRRGCRRPSPCGGSSWAGRATAVPPRPRRRPPRRRPAPAASPGLG